jgi:hypothetical protein
MVYFVETDLSTAQNPSTMLVVVMVGSRFQFLMVLGGNESPYISFVCLFVLLDRYMYVFE